MASSHRPSTNTRWSRRRHHGRRNRRTTVAATISTTITASVATATRLVQGGGSVIPISTTAVAVATTKSVRSTTVAAEVTSTTAVTATAAKIDVRKIWESDISDIQTNTPQRTADADLRQGNSRQTVCFMISVVCVMMTHWRRRRSNRCNASVAVSRTMLSPTRWNVVTGNLNGVRRNFSLPMIGNCHQINSDKNGTHKRK